MGMADSTGMVVLVEPVASVALVALVVLVVLAGPTVDQRVSSRSLRKTAHHRTSRVHRTSISNHSSCHLFFGRSWRSAALAETIGRLRRGAAPLAAEESITIGHPGPTSTAHTIVGADHRVA